MTVVMRRGYMDGRELLFKLSNSFGVSGNEHHLHGTLEEYFKNYSDEIIAGKLGDFTALKKGTSNGEFKIMIAGHSDEIGLIVKDIDERGFIYFANVAGVDAKTLPAQEVTIHGKREVYGVIGAKPPHVLTPEDMKKAIKMEDMVIDVGMSKEEVEEVITVGDFITVKRECANLLGDRITGKALDNRAGICSMLECAKELQKIKHSADVYFVATTMEEFGHLGVRTSAYSINPDIGIAVDVTFADKYADSEIPSECGKGVELTVGPCFHPELTDKLMKIADEYNIPYSVDVTPGKSGTDAWDIQVAREGIPTLLISIPLKYMHTTTEVISYSDVKKAGRLIALFISAIRDWSDVYA
jgi:tetrahedral aminopeptidase